MAILTEAMIGHQLDLLRLEAGVRTKVMNLLGQLQSELVTRLQRGDVSTYNRTKANVLIREVSEVVDGYYARAQGDLEQVLVGTADASSKATKDALEQFLTVDISIGLPPYNFLAKLAGNTLIMGAPSEEWWSRQSADTTFRFANAVRQGLAAGDTSEAIVARVSGGRGFPGVMDIARSNARSLVQSSIQSVASAARRETFKRNSDVVEGTRQVSTLDSHTTDICMAYDGAEYDLDGNPMEGTTLPYNGGVPRHWGCRSVEVPITKSFKELGLDVAEPDEGERASDQGPVDASMTFEDYLNTLTPAEQDERLGKGRAELWRDDKITLTQLLDQSGNPLTLAELQDKYAN